MRGGHGKVTQPKDDAHTDNAIMKPRSSTLTLSLLLLSVPAWGQSPPLPNGDQTHRPLNLSLPRDVMSRQTTVIHTPPEDVAVRNLRQDDPGSAKQAGRQPYGTGYEARRRGMASESGNSGFSSGAGMGGSGGRGGMGRGR